MNKKAVGAFTAALAIVALPIAAAQANDRAAPVRPSSVVVNFAEPAPSNGSETQNELPDPATPKVKKKSGFFGLPLLGLLGAGGGAAAIAGGGGGTDSPQ